MPIRYVVLDFDGTCTQVEKVQQGFLDSYKEALTRANNRAIDTEWNAALKTVIAASPKAGWTLGGSPAAPAAADPYILAGEAAELLNRQMGLKLLPPDAFKPLYNLNAPQWRDEAKEVFKTLVARGLKVGIISNSASDSVQARVNALFEDDAAFRAQLHVGGGAAKFKTRDVFFAPELPATAHRAHFDALPGCLEVPGLGRPVYLRRGAYFEALCAFWANFGEKQYAMKETLICGDIWELDLAMPRALGAHTHLITRAAPFGTCDYERAQMAPEDISADLTGLIGHIERLNK